MLRTNKEKELNSILKNSKEILVTSHLSADIDAVSSCLLFRHLVNKFYKKTKVKVVLEKPLSAETKYIDLLNLGVIDLLDKGSKIEIGNYEAVFVLDAERIDRCLVGVDQAEIKKLVIVDHHNIHGKSDLLINENKVSTTEQVFVTFEKILGRKFNIDRETAKYTQLGIITDSNNFVYEKVSSDTFRIMAKLRDIVPLDPQKLLKAINMITKGSIPILEEILKNAKYHKDYAYSIITDEMIDSGEVKKEDIHAAQYAFIDMFMRNIEGVNWGFIVRKSRSLKGFYKVSLRALEGTKKVNLIAQKLGGGGHLYSAGVLMEAESLEDAIEKIKKAALEE